MAWIETKCVTTTRHRVRCCGAPDLAECYQVGPWAASRHEAVEAAEEIGWEWLPAGEGGMICPAHAERRKDET